MISGNMVGQYSQIGKTFVIIDGTGAEYTGVVVDQETIFDATDNDVREGKVYASDSGVSTGTKVIPAYHTYEGSKIITAGSEFKIALSSSDLYDYTKLQCIICPFNSSMSNSVAAERVVINNNVYNVNTTTSIATVTKNVDEKSIDLGITNESSISYIIRFITYKEIE